MLYYDLHDDNIRDQYSSGKHLTAIMVRSKKSERSGVIECHDIVTDRQNRNPLRAVRSIFDGEIRQITNPPSFRLVTLLFERLERIKGSSTRPEWI